MFFGFLQSHDKTCHLLDRCSRHSIALTSAAGHNTIVAPMATHAQLASIVESQRVRTF